MNETGVWGSDHGGEAVKELDRLQQAARERGNTFEALVEAGKVCSLGRMCHALYDVGGSIGGICSRSVLLSR